MTTFRQGDKIYTLRQQSINTTISMRRNGGIRTHNENFCHELINYAVRIEKEGIQLDAKKIEKKSR